MRYRDWRRGIPFCADIGLMTGWSCGAVEVCATKGYSYIDDEEDPVLTDRPETILE